MAPVRDLGHRDRPKAYDARWPPRPGCGPRVQPGRLHSCHWGTDTTVRLYDADSGMERLVLRGNRWGVFSLDFSRNGTMLASGAHTEVRVWTLDIDYLLRIASDELTRTLNDEECRQYLHLETCP